MNVTKLDNDSILIKEETKDFFKDDTEAATDEEF